MNELLIYTDGASRGNPGPAAIGAVIGDEAYNEAIGFATNNIAEYKAVIFGLKKARQLVGKQESKKINIKVHSDSELIVNQLNGKYKVKDEELKPLFIDTWNLKQDFKSVSFIHIPREKNKNADDLANRALNSML